MKITNRKGIDKKLDEAWSKLVKLRVGNKCEYCKTTTKQIHSHHIYSRSKKSTRWDVLNGISLCAGHHVLSSTFSAHKTPLEFVIWLNNYKGDDYMNRLTLKANSTSKLFAFEKQVLLDDLNRQIDNLKQ